MRLLHISDLHLGKVVHGVSMLENDDQPCWVRRFLALAEELQPDAVLISGDVYDRSSPAGEAVSLFGSLLEALADLGIQVMVIPGNHDSGRRLAFARSLLSKQKVHIADLPGRSLTRVTLTDEFGPVDFWLMPYVFPAVVSQALEDETIRDYDTAVRRLLAAQPIDFSRRNVLLAHQNVTARGCEAPRGGSESMVGGVGQVDWTAFDGFEYVALGHIHAAYPVGRETVRYAGSPLCYHFNETRQPRKGPVMAELSAKGQPVRLQVLSIPPLHPMRELRGSFAELRAGELAESRQGEYLRLVLTDRPLSPEISDFFQTLAEGRGSILMDRCSEYHRSGGELSVPDGASLREKPVEALFADFFADRTGGESPDPAELALLAAAGEFVRNRTPEAGKKPGPDDPEAEALVRLLLKEVGE